MSSGWLVAAKAFHFVVRLVIAGAVAYALSTFGDGAAFAGFVATMYLSGISYRLYELNQIQKSAHGDPAKKMLEEAEAARKSAA